MCAVSSSDIESRWPYKVRILSANPFLQFKTFDIIFSKKRRDTVKHGVTTFIDDAPTPLALLPLIWYKQSPSYNLQSLSMFKVLLPEVFLEAERAHWQKFIGFVNTNNWDNPTGRGRHKIKQPFCWRFVYWQDLSKFWLKKMHNEIYRANITRWGFFGA